MGKIKTTWYPYGGENMNIVLIGMRGSGKTTIAKQLAEKLHKSFYDLDMLLAEKEKMTIAEIVHIHGWEYFREKESKITENISHQTNAVISTGGGVILHKKNIDALKKNAIFILLKTSVEAMIKRIGNDTNRPALTNKKSLKEELEEVWKERKPIYETIANHSIETDGKTVKQITEEIIKQL